jgi:hypothetical protein
MSTALFFSLPIGMLAVVWSLYFVGCSLPVSGLRDPYSDLILGEAGTGLLAYWPLNDLLGTSKTPGQVGQARDLSGNHRIGNYTNPPAYPSGIQAIPKSKVLNPPTLARGTSIVVGDAGSSTNALPASTDFEGGVVNIPWSTESWPPLNEFTIEAWIQPKWSGSGFIWVVFSAATDTAGFALFIDDTNQWGVTFGNGMMLTTATPPTNVTIDPSSTTPTYVALTFKGGIFSLWVNPGSDTSTPPPANWTSDPASYVAADPTQLLQCFIGAGANNQPPRAQDGGTGSPLFPFQGLVQSVAVYQTALGGDEVLKHFQAGVTT